MQDLILGLTKAQATDESISSFSEAIGNVPTPWEKGDVIKFPDTIEGNAFKTLIGNMKLEYIVVHVKCADGSERQDKFFPSLFRKRTRRCDWNTVDGVNIAIPTNDFVVTGGSIVEPLYTKKSKINDIVLTVLGKSIKISNVWEVKSQEYGSTHPELAKVYDFEPEGWSIHNGHEWVDLGLSVKWATCNIGASFPGECGDTFAWKHFGCDLFYLQSCGYLDEKGNLTPSMDSATANWGGSWRMPTKSEMEELVDNCTWELVICHCGIWCKATGPNGNSILLPADGDGFGCYLSSTPYDDFYGELAYGLWLDSHFSDSTPYVSTIERDFYEFIFIRPVLDQKSFDSFIN